MPGRAHHSEKWHSCWEQVKAKGHTPESAAAICTAQLGDESYASRAAQEEVEARELHLLGATGRVRTAMYEGREHLVIPVVALMEGVIHAVNAPFAEYVPADVVTASPHEWNGRPAVIFHPMKDGRQCSANDPKILESHRFGTIFNAYGKNGKLGMEVWADPKRLEALGQHELLKDLREGREVEVSVGAFVQTELRAGEFKGKQFKATWRRRAPDHIAFLPGGRGACSLEMGCGAHRAAADFGEAERYAVAEGELRVAGAPADNSLVPIALDLFRTGIGKRHSASDEEMLQMVHDHAVSLGAKCSGMRAAAPMPDKSGVDQNGKLRMQDCPKCDGLGQVDGHDCEVCEGSGKIRVASGEKIDAFIGQSGSAWHMSIKAADGVKKISFPKQHLAERALELAKSDPDSFRTKLEKIHNLDLAESGDAIVSTLEAFWVDPQSASEDEILETIGMLRSCGDPEGKADEYIELLADKRSKCPKCDGLGQIAGEDCPRCKGTGKERYAAAEERIATDEAERCVACSGTGIVSDEDCSLCGGVGRINFSGVSKTT